MRNAIAVATTCVVAVSSAIGLNDVSLRGDVRPADQRVAAHIGTEVRTPLGRLSVTGNTDVRYTCDRGFSGTVTYSRFIRALAAMRHISLVTRVEGSLDESTAFGCGISGDSVVGAFVIRDSVLTGSVRYGTSTTLVRGAVKRNGSAYDIALVADSDSTRSLAHVVLK